MRALRPQLGLTETARLRRWWRSCAGDAAGALGPAPTHGNLAPEHLLLDDEARDLHAVLGWSRLAVADPALDLAAVAPHYGADFAWLVMEAYRGAGGAVDADFLRRVRLQASLAPVLAWGSIARAGRAGPGRRHPGARRAAARRTRAGRLVPHDGQPLRGAQTQDLAQVHICRAPARPAR